MTLRRSCLVVPGHSAKMHAKALSAGADEVVFDLEDAVAPDAKDAAREQVRTTLSAPEWRERQVAIRINPRGSDHQAADLALCASLDVEGLTLVVPKVESVQDVEAGAAIAAVQALIETPRGLAAAAAVAAHASVVALILGYADLAASLGRRGAERDLERWLVAQEALLAAARIGDAQAVDGPFFGLRDERGVARAARAARELGFDGKWAIHPAQVAPLNAAFAPSPAERRWAQGVVAAVDAAGRQGGAAATVDGGMVDEAMVRQARRLLALPFDAPPEADAPRRRVAAPYYDDLATGTTFRAPGVTLTGGHAALHQAIVGDRLRLALDGALYEAVTGTPGLLAHPMLVCDVAIGQSTAPSARVLGNLFYRGLGARPVAVGTTLRTTTEVVARRDASRGRGIVVLRVTTVDAQGEPVLDFWRAPLLPGGGEAGTGDADDLAAVGHPVDVDALVPRSWDLAALRAEPLGSLFMSLAEGDTYEVEAAETVTAATELARLSLNLAHTHTDAAAGAHGARLVYGGHVIGIAAAHVTRALPDLATILAWESCDHLGPTFEGDRLRTRIEVVGLDPLADGGLVRLRVLVAVIGDDDDAARDVLDWRLIGLMP
ncbi:MAG TPA: aldolase/citrate lyase family protein [Baekduia sp.]|nr:aldolase/citrate lyase family protein [Baekduia sp.]